MKFKDFNIIIDTKRDYIRRESLSSSFQAVNVLEVNIFPNILLAYLLASSLNS